MRSKRLAGKRGLSKALASTTHLDGSAHRVKPPIPPPPTARSFLPRARGKLSAAKSATRDRGILRYRGTRGLRAVRVDPKRASPSPSSTRANCCNSRAWIASPSPPVSRTGRPPRKGRRANETQRPAARRRLWGRGACCSCRGRSTLAAGCRPEPCRGPRASGADGRRPSSSRACHRSRPRLRPAGCRSGALRPAPCAPCA